MSGVGRTSAVIICDAPSVHGDFSANTARRTAIFGQHDVVKGVLKAQHPTVIFSPIYVYVCNCL